MHRGGHTAQREAPLVAEQHVNENADESVNDGQYALLGEVIAYLWAYELDPAHDDLAFHPLLQCCEHSRRDLYTVLFTGPGRNAHDHIAGRAKSLHYRVGYAC